MVGPYSTVIDVRNDFSRNNILSHRLSERLMGIPFVYKPDGLSFIVPDEAGMNPHEIAENLTACCIAFNINAESPLKVVKINVDLKGDWRQSDAVKYLANSLGMYFSSFKDFMTRDMEGAGSAGAAIFCLPENNGFSLNMSRVRVLQVLGLGTS